MLARIACIFYVHSYLCTYRSHTYEHTHVRASSSMAKSTHCWSRSQETHMSHIRSHRMYHRFHHTYRRGTNLIIVDQVANRLRPKFNFKTKPVDGRSTRKSDALAMCGLAFITTPPVSTLSKNSTKDTLGLDLVVPSHLPPRSFNFGFGGRRRSQLHPQGV